MIDSLANIVVRRPLVVLLIMLAAVAVAGAFGGPRIPDILANAGDPFEDPTTQSVVGREKLEDATGRQPGAGAIVLIELDAGVDEPASREHIEAIARAVRDVDGVAEAPTWYETKRPDFVSEDRLATFIPVEFEAGTNEETVAAAVHEAVADERGVRVGGSGLVGETIGETVSGDIARAERIAMPLLFLAALFVFRSAVAALLPVLVGALTIAGSFFGLALVNTITPMTEYAMNLTIALGLGLAVDYSLFVVSRFREELEAGGGAVQAALQATMATAGRTVLFSALTVAAALAALLVFPQRFMFSMGVGGVITALVAAVISLTILPAVLALLGTRVNSLAPRRWREATRREALRESRGGWYRLSRAVMRRPVPVALVTGGAMLAMGVPFLDVKFQGVDVTVLPRSSEVRQVADVLERDFPATSATTMPVVIDGDDGDEAAVRAIADRIATLDHADETTPPQPAGDGVWTMQVSTDAEPLSDEAKALVDDIIDSGGGEHTVYVAGGETARFVDQRDSLGARLPLAIAVLAVTTFVLLFLMTGSIVLPLKSLLMNLLSVSAAFGLLVMIFQWGHLEGLLDYESQGALEMTQPILLFAIAFGLSTDYGVFLLNRIKEARDAGLGETESVAVGVERTGRIVTAAALLFCIAIGAFSTSRIVFIKELGIGTALAVLIDATIVRAFLVPSLMALLGSRNWWAPGPLRRLHDRFGISEGGPAHAGDAPGQ